MQANHLTLGDQNGFAQLCSLCKQACSSSSMENKQKALDQLRNYYAIGALTPEILLTVFTCGEDCLDTANWHITCFTLAQILYDCVDVFPKQRLRQWEQLIVKILEAMHLNLNEYHRVFASNHQLTPKGPKAESYLANSMKRTLCMLMKYQTKHSVSLSELPTFQRVMILSNLKLTNLSPKEKRPLYFCFEICLCFINQLLEKNTKVQLIEELRAIQNFQSKVITHIIKLMPLMISTIDHEFDIHELESSMNKILQFGQATTKNVLGAAFSTQMELSLAMIEALLYFPYLLEDVEQYASKPALVENIVENKQKQNQIGVAFLQPSFRYPRQIAMLFCSKDFLNQLFNIPKKILTFIKKQLQQMNKHGNPSRIYSYLYYYRLIMQYLTRIAGIDLQLCPHKKLNTQIEQMTMIMTENSDEYVKVSQNFITVILQNVFSIIDGDLSEMFSVLEGMKVGSEGWNFFRELVIRLDQATMMIMCKLIQNKQLTAVIKQSRLTCPKNNNKLGLDETFTKICFTFAKTTQRHINLTPNITLSSMLTQPPITITPHSSTNFFLRYLFNFWLHIVHERQYIVLEQNNWIQMKDKTDSWICEVIYLLIGKFVQQDLSIFSEDGAENNTNHYQISELNDEMTSILRFIKMFLKAASKKYQAQISAYLWNFIQKMFEEIKQVYKTFLNLPQQIQNKINNIILLTKYLILQSSQQPKQDNYLSSAQQTQYTQNLTINNQNIINCMYQYLRLTSAYKYSAKSNQIVTLVYQYAFYKYWLISVMDLLNQGKVNVEKTKLTSFYDHFFLLTCVFMDKYMPLLRQLVFTDSSAQQFKTITELSKEFIKVLSNLSQNIRKVMLKYNSIVSIANEAPNHEANLFELEIYLGGMIWLYIQRMKDSYNKWYIQIPKNKISLETEKRFACVMELYQNFVEIYVFIHLSKDFSKPKTNQMNIYGLEQTIEIVMETLGLDANKQNKQYELYLQFCIVNLTGVYQSFSKSTSYGKMPLKFLRRVQKFTPINKLMSAYIISEIQGIQLELNQKILPKLLKLNKAILNGINRDNELTATELHEIYGFVGQCLSFWISVAEDIDTGYRKLKENKCNILEKFYDVLVVILEIFMALMKRNSINSKFTLNFSLLGRTFPNFDRFFQLMLKLMAILYSHQQFIDNHQNDKKSLSLKLHPELKKLTDNCFKNISEELGEFIFDFRNHKIGKQIIAEQTKLFLPSYTEIFVLKIKQFIQQARLFSGRRTNWSAKEIYLQDTNLYTSINIIQMNLYCIRTLLAYEHNSHLQNNINEFLLTLYNFAEDLHPKRNQTAFSFGIQPTQQGPLMMVMFFEIIKLGLNLTQCSNSYKLNITIGSTLVQLAPIFTRYQQIQKKQFLTLKKSCLYLLHKELKISQNFLTNFDKIWKETEDDVPHQQLKQHKYIQKLKEWFRSCYKFGDLK